MNPEGTGYDFSRIGELEEEAQQLKLYNEQQQSQASQGGAQPTQPAEGEQEQGSGVVNARTGKPLADDNPEATHLTKDPKKFGLGENILEARNALAGGGVDLYNSVVSIPKFFDPNFYKPDDPSKPYLYSNPLVVTDKPITKTVWGSVLRTFTEFAGGMLATGGIGTLAKGAAMALPAVRGAVAAPKVAGVVNAVGKLPAPAKAIAGGALKGASYDVISNQSHNGNIASEIIKVKPEWAAVLKPIATTDDMSPAQRALFNMFEGMGIGALMDSALLGAGVGVRALRKRAPNLVTDPRQAAIERSARIEYAQKTTKVEDIARKELEKQLYRKAKAEIDKEDLLIWEAQTGSKEGFVSRMPGIGDWRAANAINKTDPWKMLDETTRQNRMEEAARGAGIDWGPQRDPMRRATKQGAANQAVANDELVVDTYKGEPRENPAYFDEGDVTDHQALTSTTRAIKGVRDLSDIRNNPLQAQGSPRGPLTEAHIRRIEYSAPGLTTKEIEQLGDQLIADPAFQEMFGGKTPKMIKEDFMEANEQLFRFLKEDGNQRAVQDLSQDELKQFIDNYARFKNNGELPKTQIEGREILNHAQLVATDLVIGQLTHSMRDLARASLSIQDEVFTGAAGSLADGIFNRWGALMKLRKETSTLSSWNLRRFSPGLEDMTELLDATDALVENGSRTMRKLVADGANQELLETFNHFIATGGTKLGTIKDFDAWMRRNLQGYKNGNGLSKAKLIDELATMGINSMLSGPKTVGRAVVGTGMGTVLRPMATIIGSLGTGNQRQIRASMTSLGAMIDGLGESWRMGIADFHAYTQSDGWRGVTNTAKDYEWNALHSYVQLHGGAGEKAAYQMANAVRTINKIPLFNYGPRLLQASDTFFRTMIGRARMRELAFNDLWERASDLGLSLDDTSIEKLAKQAEFNFESKVFSADGQLTDDFAKFMYDEAALTRELRGSAKKFDEAFKAAPWLRPFMVFMKTGVNALENTAKYTPILNNFITESTDILTRNFDDPKLLTYGIKSQTDLEAARAAVRGKQAIGYGFTAMAGILAASGKITGNGPPDRELRESWKQYGWRPRSFKIGNSYVSYEALEPFNAFLSLTADIADASKVMGEEWTSDWMGKLSYLVAQNVTNKSFLAGLFQVTEVFQGGMKAESFLGNFVNNQIPLGSMRNEIGKVLSPGMRELEKGFLDSVYNRNLWVDVLPGSSPNYRYDILNGEPLMDYDLPTRFFNAVSPFNINIGVTPTRDMLFRSGVDLKLTFNTGPNGENFEGHPDLKSKYQYYVGQQNLEKQLEKLFSHPQIVESIKQMEADRDAGRRYDPATTLHNTQIMNLLNQAKRNAWYQLQQDPDVQELTRQSQIKAIAGQHRKAGNTTTAEQIQTLLEMNK